jgi:hypothetical protein
MNITMFGTNPWTARRIFPGSVSPLRPSRPYVKELVPHPCYR